MLLFTSKCTLTTFCIIFLLCMHVFIFVSVVDLDTDLSCLSLSFLGATELCMRFYVHFINNIKCIRILRKRKFLLLNHLTYLICGHYIKNVLCDVMHTFYWKIPLPLIKLMSCLNALGNLLLDILNWLYYNYFYKWLAKK